RHSREKAYRHLRADSADTDQLFEKPLFAHRPKPVKREDILTDMGIGEERKLGAFFGQIVKSRDRYGDEVTYAVNVQHHMTGLFFDQNSLQMADHVAAF